VDVRWKKWRKIVKIGTNEGREGERGGFFLRGVKCHASVFATLHTEQDNEAGGSEQLSW
jgi:hypothetical protein